MTNYKGIDYSGIGATCNRDSDTGIRYGIIPMNALHEFAWDDFEVDYGPPYCPECGNEIKPFVPDVHRKYNTYKNGCDDFACEACKLIVGSDYAFGDEPDCWIHDTGEFRAQVDSSNDVWIFKSLCFTYAQFCSPCAPGACYLVHPLDEPCESNKCYCLSHEWFESGVAPYPVYSVATGELIQPETKD
jgi:hypothetical protein